MNGIRLIFALLAFAALTSCKPAGQTSEADDFDLEMKDGPTCMIRVRLPQPGDNKRLTDAVARFAAAHQIPLSPVRAFSTTGRETPRIYANQDVLIATMLFDIPPIPQAQQYGQIRINVLRRSYPIPGFLALAEEFHTSFQREFGDLVDLWETPSDGANELKP
ncbi:MAG: hypothetical protein ABJF10_01290 [Chthoniobacter sp.]|uniref:hypothetical protein n=1 Tax=Chthoniobacter sp. TaxID=2510640 RepID=UPI0032A6B6DF